MPEMTGGRIREALVKAGIIDPADSVDVAAAKILTFRAKTLNGAADAILKALPGADSPNRPGMRAAWGIVGGLVDEAAKAARSAGPGAGQ